MYTYEQILHGLCSKSSNVIELSLFEPRCIRRRRSQPLTEESIPNTRTVIVIGLPMDVSENQLGEFFARFYPIENLEKHPSFSQRFPGKVHVIFKTSANALAFVEQSKRVPMKYINYPIVCQMLNNIKIKSVSSPPVNLSGKSIEVLL